MIKLLCILRSSRRLHYSLIVLLLLLITIVPVLSQEETPEPEPPPDTPTPTYTAVTPIPDTDLPPTPTLEITTTATPTTTLTATPEIAETLVPTETPESTLTDTPTAEIPELDEEPVIPSMSEIESFSMMPLSFSDPRTYIDSTEAVIAPADVNMLQQAINTATSSSPYTIYLLEGEYLISTRLLMSNKNIRIYGRGAGITILRRDTTSALNEPMMHVYSGTTLTLSHVTIRDGNATLGLARGGAIQNYHDNDQVYIYDSEFLNNHATNRGGAIVTHGGTLSIQRSIFTDNTSTRGGAIFSINNNDDRARIYIECTRFENNIASERGGVISGYRFDPSTTIGSSTTPGSSGNNFIGNYEGSPPILNDIHYYDVLVSNSNPQISALDNWWGQLGGPVTNQVRGNVDVGTAFPLQPISCPMEPPVPLPTPSPTPTPIVTATPIPTSYPIGIGLPTPLIANPSAYGPCVEDTIVNRPGCAVQAYLAAYNEFSPLRWEDFIALTIHGEGAVLYISPGTSPLDLQCVYSNVNDITCDQLRGLLERAMMRQIYEACGLDGSCTEQEFVTFLSGWPNTSNNPPNPIFGIEAWYNAGRATGIPDLSQLRGLNDAFLIRIPNADSMLQNMSLEGGCGSFACSWGNPQQKPPPPSEYASYIDPSATYGVFDGRVYFIVGAQ